MAPLGAQLLGAALPHLALAAAAPPVVRTPLGDAVGAVLASGVERFGGLPYALPPLGPRRFARAEVNDAPWADGRLDATSLGPPCVQSPVGDPRSPASESGPPTEDCLRLNIWRPPAPNASLPVMVYLFGGGLCSGFAGNEYTSGASLALRHGVVVVTVQYRLGPLGFLVGEDPARPGSGGMNGIHDTIVALQWLKKYIAAFGGDPSEITLFGQSSGGYSVCTLCVAPEARGLFRRASLLSGPCFGGPPGRGWGPVALDVGRNITRQLLDGAGARSLEDLRRLPAEQLQWPEEWMSDLTKAPYFSAYFPDPAVLPESAEALWRRGQINPEELLVSFTSKDGTSAFYGTAPTLGLVGADTNASTPEGYVAKMTAAWGSDAEVIMQRYPLTEFPTAASAFVQADADVYVICPSRRLAREAAAAGRRVWVSEFAHFQPSPSQPQGCSGYGPGGCAGFGCDNGVELDVVPARRDESTRFWATHGADYHFIFGTESGPDGVGPPNNVTDCTFDPEEAELSESMMARWASFARHGDPNIAALPGSVAWPAVAGASEAGRTAMRRLRFSTAGADGAPTALVDDDEEGMQIGRCAFWEALYPLPATNTLRQAEGGTLSSRDPVARGAMLPDADVPSSVRADLWM